MQAAALQTFQCCCHCRGDLGQPGVGEGRLKYRISHRGSSQNRCPFHHLMENTFHGHHQKTGSGASHLLTKTLAKSRGCAPALVWGCMFPPLGTAGMKGGGGGNAAPSAGLGTPVGPMARAAAAPPTADAALAPLLLSPPGRASGNFSSKPA